MGLKVIPGSVNLELDGFWVKYDFEHVFLKLPVLWHVGKMCSAANVIYSNSHLQMCGYGVSVGKVRIISASTSALYHFEHPHIRRSAHPHFTRGP